MRKLIAGMKVSVDQKIEGTEGYADWVDAWSDDYDLMPQVDACLLERGCTRDTSSIGPRYRMRRTSVLPMTGKFPTPAEIEYAHFTAKTRIMCFEHPVFGALAQDEFRPGTRRNCRPQAATGKGHLSRGGARTAASLIDAGLVDELRLIVHPLIAGEGKALFQE